MDDKLNVLLVDDEADLLVSLSGQLQELGLNVLSASEGEEALEIMKGISIHVVVLDLVMEGMSGIETLQEIKKFHPQTAVILLSGMADLELAVQGMQLGAFDYFLKPMDPSVLAVHIRDSYTRESLMQDLRSAESKG